MTRSPERGRKPLSPEPWIKATTRSEADEDGGDAEPSLGAPERHPHSIDTSAFNGLAVPRSGCLHHAPEKSQERWADGLAEGVTVCHGVVLLWPCDSSDGPGEITEPILRYRHL